MIEISLEGVNEKAPYRVTRYTRPGFYQFETDYGVKYTVGFDKDDTSLQTVSYQLVIVNINGKHSPLDAKLRDTIISLVEAFFAENNEVVLYICETGDGKQAFRERLFERWMTRYRGGLNVSRFSTTIVDDGVMNFATIILRNDHPHYQEVIDDFANTSRMLSSKPD